MALNRPVTLEDVTKVCNKLVKKNEAISHRAIRMELGSGSMTTIAKYMAEWRSNQEGKSSHTNKKPKVLLRNTVTKNIRVSNSSDIVDDVFEGVSEGVTKVSDTPPLIHSNLIQFPCSNNNEKVVDDLSQRLANLENLIETLTGENEKLQSAILFQKEADTAIKLEIQKQSYENAELRSASFLQKEADTEKQRELNKIKAENEELRSELTAQTNLKFVWSTKLKALASPESLSGALDYSLGSLTSIVKFLVIASLIGMIVWLSVHISGDFFGAKGFETAAGILLGGGVLCFLARSAESVSRAIFFRGLAYTGTAAFLMVSYSGLNDKSLQENESYLASKKSIQSLEERISGVSKIISALPPDFGKLREKEYARQDQLKRQLDAEKQKLSTIIPNSSADISTIGNFIARFLLDVLVYALFEVLAGLFLWKKKEV